MLSLSPMYMPGHVTPRPAGVQVGHGGRDPFHIFHHVHWPAWHFGASVNALIELFRCHLDEISATADQAVLPTSVSSEDSSPLYDRWIYGQILSVKLSTCIWNFLGFGIKESPPLNNDIWISWDLGLKSNHLWINISKTWWCSFTLSFHVKLVSLHMFVCKL